MEGSTAKSCLSKQEWFKSLKLEEDSENVSYSPHEEETEGVDQLTDIVHTADRNTNGSISFSEQLFLRQVGSSWRQCVFGDAMN